MLDPALYNQPSQPQPHRPATPRPPPLPDSIKHLTFNAPPAPPPVERLLYNDWAGDDEADDPAAAGSAEPSINNLALSPVVLAVTVDGHVHGLQRTTGQWLWTLHDDGGAAAGAGATGGAHSSSGRLGSTNPLTSPLVKSRSRRTTVPSPLAPRSNDTAVAPAESLDEEVYVIEPAGPGAIYLYTKSDGALQKLPLSMQELVNLEAFTFPTDDSRMFVGQKESKLVGVDLRTGRLVGVFGNGDGWCEWDQDSDRATVAADECDDHIQRRPEDLLYMAKTEYHLSVWSKQPHALLQQLTYTTYASSSATSPLQLQWTATPDSRYLQPFYEGTLIAFKIGQASYEWKTSFDSPVMAVFDLAIDTTSGPRAQPLMFEQPRLLPTEFGGMARGEGVYLGKIGDELYAMSRERFPLVEFAPAAGKANRRETLDGGEQEGEHTAGEGGECDGIDCLEGLHPLPAADPTDAMIDHTTPPLLIDSAPASTSTVPPDRSTPRPIQVGTHYPHSSSPHPPTQSTLGPLKALSQGSPEATVVMGIIIAVLGYLYARRVWTSKTQKAVEDRINQMRGEWLGAQGSARPPTLPHFDSPLPSIPIPDRDRTTSPANPALEAGSPRSSSSGHTSTPPSPALIQSGSSTAGLTPALHQGAPTSIGSSPATSPLRSRANTVTRSKELPPLPTADENGDPNADVDGESDGEGADGTPKKKSRRRRGKKTKKGGPLGQTQLKLEEYVAGASSGSGVVSPVVGEAGDRELGSLALTEAEVKDDGTEGAVIGGLAVSDTILGYGSHGTVVLKGEFQGRAVAVKRLLKDFVTIATHEVALLQESDDHPHVIRYFCKEQRDTFLYIALELCPASLYDLIDQPGTFPALVEALEPKKALRQIASGIRHLHKLKIVHRDIKPQNILVSSAKHGGLRMLISDFGLCKKLDLDESSFQQTVNHAAGSFGYRAPEVLRGQVDPDALGGMGGPGSNGGSSTVGSPPGSTLASGGGLMTDPAMRLTRSIDIFSLGCIFYYVLTGGEHPFGGRYEREMNILQGKLSLESLDGLGEEAVEAQDLITKMVATDPRQRPSAEAVLLHPFFWTAQKRLLFLCDASDRFEIMDRDPPEPTLVVLESHARQIVGDDWAKALDRTFLDNLGKYRKYDGASVRDLLRVLRNKKHHYQDLPEPVRVHLGSLPAGFLQYFTGRFPGLLLCVWETVAAQLHGEDMFRGVFELPGEGEE